MPKPVPEPIPGVRVVTERNSSASPSHTSASVSFFATDRSRIESQGSEVAGYTIERRDLATQYRIDCRLRQYRALPIWDLLSEREKERFLRSGRHWRERFAPEPPPDAPEYRIQFVYERSGEEKNLFGCTAHRWITRRRDCRDPVHGTSSGETISDGWYLDTEEFQARYPGFSDHLIHHAVTLAKSRNERVVFEHQGEKPRGICAESLSTTRSYTTRPNGETVEHVHTQQTRIASITPELFTPALFDPPRHFRQIPIYPGRFSITMYRIRGILSKMRHQLI